MKLYEAIASIVNEFGKEIVTKAKVINVFNDYNAFEESKTFKVIIKNLIAEGYMDQLMYVRDWNSSQQRIISNFIAATSFNEANATYVIQSLGYGLGYTEIQPAYNPSNPTSQPVSPYTSAAQHSTQKTTGSIPASINGIKLDKTASQFQNLSEASQQKYMDAAEAYLESIVEFKTDFEKDLGVKISTYIEFDQFANILPKFEIDGKIKVKYDYSIMFYLLVYNETDRLITKEEIYVGVKRGNFEVAQTCLDPSRYRRVSNIKRIIVYWGKD